MSRHNWSAVRRAAQNPEKRAAIRELLEKAYAGRKLHESALAMAQVPLASESSETQEGERAKQVIHCRAKLAEWEQDISQLERILRETAGQVRL